MNDLKRSSILKMFFTLMYNINHSDFGHVFISTTETEWAATESVKIHRCLH